MMDIKSKFLDEILNCPDVEWKELKEIADIKRGVRLVRSQLFEDAEYPVYQNSMKPLGYYDQSNVSSNTTFVIGAGAAGEIGYSSIDFWAADDCFYFDCTSALQDRYLYHVLISLQVYISSQVRRSSIPRLARTVLEKLEIPLPPLATQQKIVDILDTFTTLTAELTAELTARKQQYDYYRDELLTFGEAGAKWRTLEEIAEFRRGSFPQPYGNAQWYDGDDAMPFVQVADIDSNMKLVSDTNRKISKLAQTKSVFVSEGSVIVSLQGSIGRVAITQYDCYVDRTVGIFLSYNIPVSVKYFAYQLERIFAFKSKNARGSTIKTITKKEFSDFKIPVPSLDEQARIVEVLDKFDALTNCLTEGLPREIELRQLQYEYYRDLLLSFPKPDEVK